ncbi:MAG: ROK family protein [Nitrososphaerales archaeon]
MALRSGNKDLMRDINRHLVLNLIKNQGRISRTQVAADSGLAQGTVTNITRDLIAAGLVREVASGPSTGGRRPILLEIDPAGGFALGMKLIPGRVILALTDLEGSVCRSQVAPTADAADVTAYVASLEAAMKGFLQAAEVEPDRLIGTGIGLPGFIDHASGVCRNSALLGWHDVPLEEMLEANFPSPVVLDNDVNTLTLYEALFGSGRGLEDFLVVTTGRGIGMGAVVNGRMMRGAGGGAGEFGHIPMSVDGPVCSCGRRGCLEALASDPALVGQGQAAGLKVKSAADLVALARAGDATARALYGRAGDWLGRGLATLVNVFNPHRIILSGEGMHAAEFLMPGVEAAMSAHVFGGLAENLTLSVEPLDDVTWARGAASLALDALFGQPVYKGPGEEGR